MTPSQLPLCHFLGPYDEDDPPDPHGIPANWTGDPFEYLPPRCSLSDEELELAAKYERSDISGGYIRSQIAHFRKPKSQERHTDRKQQVSKIVAAADAGGFGLPSSFLKLVQTDDCVDRIRHNTIWLNLFSELVPFQHDPKYALLEMFYESQGCGYWALLLGPDGFHCVVYYGESLRSDGLTMDGHSTRTFSLIFYRCARNFDEWLAYYFLDCRNSDRNYEELLKQFPGM